MQEVSNDTDSGATVTPANPDDVTGTPQHCL